MDQARAYQARACGAIAYPGHSCDDYLAPVTGTFAQRQRRRHFLVGVVDSVAPQFVRLPED